MEDIFDVYEMSYDPAVPVVYMDEKLYQRLGDTREPLPGTISKQILSILGKEPTVSWYLPSLWPAGVMCHLFPFKRGTIGYI